MTQPIEWLKEAESVNSEVIDLRRRIHANPELGNQLPETTAAVIEAISDLELDIRYSQTTTAIVATLQGDHNGPRILLRGDMDALPMPEDNGLPYASKNDGVMHSCGHDSHTAMLAGAARALSRHKSQIHGSVDFFFQTGEEGHFGAKLALDEGLFDPPQSPDAVFAIHINPMMEAGSVASKPGPLLAAADEWEICIRGKGGHASMPHDCYDPIPVACEIVQAFNTFVTRQINVFDPVVLTTTKIEAGTTTNVIPETAKLWGTLRSTSEKSRMKSHKGIERIARQIASAYEMEVEFKMGEGYPVTVNDMGFANFAREVATNLLGKNKVKWMPSPMMGAEDFSFLLQRWPGAMFFLGVKPNDGSVAAPCHSNKMILNENAMIEGVALHAAIATNWLKQQGSP